MVNHFDPEQLKRDLGTISPVHWIAYCAAISGRLLPNYEEFAAEEGQGNPDVLRTSLERVWYHFTGSPLSQQECTILAERCADAAPYPELFESDFVSAALDAANAVSATLLCCRDGDVDRCVEVATYARDTVDMFLQMRGLVDPEGSDLEQEILEHPLMALEMERQQEVLDVLRASPAISEAVIDRLRRQQGNLAGYYREVP